MDLVEQIRQNLKESVGQIRVRLRISPEVGIILGTGLASVVDILEEPVALPYGEIPHFPGPLVPGHPGYAVGGRLEGRQVLALQGRPHYYEGYTMSGTTFPVRVLSALDVKTLITTCAAGALSRRLRAGDIMLIVDHMNLMGDNPLIGAGDAFAASSFVDLTDAYDPVLAGVARRAAKTENVGLKEGIYAAVSGPSYETPAEVRILSQFADAVGMSMVPEVIVARHEGMRVLGLAVITNEHGAPLKEHESIVRVAEAAAGGLGRLIRAVIADSEFEMSR